MTTPIDSFTGQFSFLSNFHFSPVQYDDVTYSTVEHAYQAAKTQDKNERSVIAAAPTPGKAKRLGRKVKMREDWDKIKVDVMKELLEQKFRISHFKNMLLLTYPQQLIEGNTWGDTFWGVCNGRGSNHLGLLLMEIRNQLLDNQTHHDFIQRIIRAGN